MYLLHSLIIGFKLGIQVLIGNINLRDASLLPMFLHTPPAPGKGILHYLILYLFRVIGQGDVRIRIRTRHLPSLQAPDESVVCGGREGGEFVFLVKSRSDIPRQPHVGVLVHPYRDDHVFESPEFREHGVEDIGSLNHYGHYFRR